MFATRHAWNLKEVSVASYMSREGHDWREIQVLISHVHKNIQ